jgi:hypothetical protein
MDNVMEEMRSSKLQLDLHCHGSGMETLSQIPPCFLMSGPFALRKPAWCQIPGADRKVIFEEIHSGQVKDVGNAPFYIIGRNERAHIVLNDLMVSRCHAVLLHNGNGDCYLLDLGSSHGTFIGSSKIVPYTPTLVKKSSIIRFGSMERQYIIREFPKVNVVLEAVKSIESAEEQTAYLNKYHNQASLMAEELARYRCFSMDEHETGSSSSGYTDQSDSSSDSSSCAPCTSFTPDCSIGLYRRDTVDYTERPPPIPGREGLQRSFSLDVNSTRKSHECNLSSPMDRKRVRFSAGDLSVFAEEVTGVSCQQGA